MRPAQDKRFGRGFVHSMWHADFVQRQSSGISRDLISNLRDSAAFRALGISLCQLFSAFGVCVLTLDWGLSDAHAAALQRHADVLACARFTPLRTFAESGTTARARAQQSLCAWLPDSSTRPLKRFGAACHRLTLDANVGEVARITLLPRMNDEAQVSFYVSLVFFDRETRRRIVLPTERATTSGAGLACITWVVENGQECMEMLLSVTGGSDDDAEFAPCEWGKKPSQLPTLRYALLLEGCAPHKDATLTRPPMHALQIPEHGVLCIPTGLANFFPRLRLGGGGPSLTCRDIRSGNPGEMSYVDLAVRLGLPTDSSVSQALLTGVQFVYRNLCGYSNATGSPGPKFQLRLVQVDADGDDCDTPLVLFASPELDAAPFCFDACNGGSPINYSPEIVATRALNETLRCQSARLQLVFINGRRNMHLQGADFPQKLVDLELKLFFGGAEPLSGARQISPRGMPRDGQLQAEVSFLCEAIPDLEQNLALKALVANGGDVNAALSALMSS
uniref:UBA domain-containing protein n=1 Tax=Chrysotila carterae TaxID=13221 RepID=A0A7S4BA62_CHRCT